MSPRDARGGTSIGVWRDAASFGMLCGYMGPHGTGVLAATSDRPSAPAWPPVPTAPPLDRRVVPWSEAQLTGRACPLCEARDVDPVVRRPDGLIVGRCTECGLLYLPRIPTAEALADFYAAYSNSHQAWHAGKTRDRALRSARRRRGGNGLLDAIGRHRRLRGRRLLEIGCSRGSFLLDAREAGAEVAGIEIDLAARTFVTSLGVPCFGSLGDLESMPRWDIAVALNVIEHVPDPRAWLSSVARLLADDGLLVLWTPNATQAEQLGAGWAGFRVDLDHLTYFSPRTLGAALVGAGLWPEALWELSQPVLTGFRETESSTASRVDRILTWLRRAPVETWKLPPGGGSYTLCLFAGKA